MIVAILVSEFILGINFLKECNVVINLTEVSFETRRDGSDCEQKFLYRSLRKNKVEVDFISKQKFQLKFSELKRQSDGEEIIVGVQATQALIPMQQESQKELFSICDEIKMDKLGCYAVNRQTCLSNNVSHGDKAVADRVSTKEIPKLNLL